jgi:hypothetical protein
MHMHTLLMKAVRTVQCMYVCITELKQLATPFVFAERAVKPYHDPSRLRG